MASAAAGIEFFASSVGVGPDGGAVGTAAEDHHASDHERHHDGRRKQPAKQCALADSLRSGDRHGTSVVGQSGDLPGPGAALDERGDRVVGEIAVIDDRGDHDRGWRLLRALQADDRRAAGGACGWDPQPRPTQLAAKLAGRAFELRRRFRGRRGRRRTR